MKKLSVLLIGIFLLSSGCITVQSYTKPGFDFSKIKKIAIVKLISHEEDVPLYEIETDEKSAGLKKGDKRLKSQDVPLAEIETDEKSAQAKKKSTKFRRRAMPLSQIATDEIILGFGKEGINIIEIELLNVSIDENLIIQYGLTESERNKLAFAGIDGVIVGTVTTIGRRGELSLSLKMFNTKSGDIVWRGKVNEVDANQLDNAVKK